MGSSWIELSFPILGAIVANYLWFSSLSVVRQSKQNSTLGATNPIPFAFAAVSAASWTAYSFTMDDSLSAMFVFIANFPGMMVSIYYVFTTIPLASKQQRDNISFILLAITGLLMTISFISVQSRGVSSPNQVVGFMAVGIFIIFTASPMQTFVQVFRTKDSSSINFSMSLALLVNCLCWTAFALVINDIFILIPEVFGTVQALLQLTVRFIYPPVAVPLKTLEVTLTEEVNLENGENPIGGERQEQAVPSIPPAAALPVEQIV